MIKLMSSKLVTVISSKKVVRNKLNIRKGISRRKRKHKDRGIYRVIRRVFKILLCSVGKSNLKKTQKS